MPSTMPSAPSGSTGTFMYQLMFETRSRLPRPWRPPSARKFSAQACCAQVWWPYRSVFDSFEHAPPRVSCRPTSSATTVISGPYSQSRSTEPVVRNTESWPWMVSGAL